jgi:hypothetical protein
VFLLFFIRAPHLDSWLITIICSSTEMIGCKELPAFVLYVCESVCVTGWKYNKEIYLKIAQ